MSTPRAARRRGSALLVALVATSAVAVTSLAVVELATAARRHALADAARVRAAAIAEAGLDEALRTVAAGAPAGAARTFAGGRVTSTVTDRADGSGVHDLVATATWGDATARVEAAAVQSGTEVVLLAWRRTR